jgi:hypothetical protein
MAKINKFTSKLNRLRGRYNAQEKEEKEAYKKRKGLKIAVGFKDTDEYKRIRKNKLAALRRYDIKSPRRARKVAKAYQDGKFTELENIAIGESFLITLSYGSGVDKTAMTEFKNEKLAGSTTVLFDGSRIGFGTQRANNIPDYSRLMQEAHQYATNETIRLDLPSMGVLTDIVSGLYEGARYITIKMYFGKV